MVFISLKANMTKYTFPVSIGRLMWSVGNELNKMHHYRLNYRNKYGLYKNI